MRALNPCLLVACFAAGCSYAMPAPSRERAPGAEHPSPIYVGTARVDVTPPPGVSTFGHATDSRVSDGVWTRLYCRVFAFKTEQNERYAIVPCDLAAISTLLQRSVAAGLRDVIPATRLMLTATHTHAGPAHYFDAEAFSNAFSSELPGFDPKLLDLLATRIASGVRAAFAATQPAQLRFAHYEGGDRSDQGMWGITWNRSLRAHAANGTEDHAPEGLSAAERAIDPALHVLRIEQLDAEGEPRNLPIGAIAFFAMHPTVLPHENRLLGADTHGVISRVLEQKMKAEWAAQPGAPASDPLFGIINTNEGDIAPKWFEGTKSEAIAVGRSVATRIEALLEAAPRPHSRVTLKLRYREVDLPRARVEHGKERGALCELAEPGESFPHGACDHPGDFDVHLINPGRPYGGACQAPKRGLFGQYGAIIAGGEDAFPRRVPLALFELDDSLIAFVPAELTVAAGAQLKRAVLAEQSAASQVDRHVFVAGLANGYMLYVTSYAEFGFQALDGGCLVPTIGGITPALRGGVMSLDKSKLVSRQSYEAGSNLYGPRSAGFFAEQFGLLSRSLRDPHDPRVRELMPAIGEATAFRVVPGIERPRLARVDRDTKKIEQVPGSLCALHEHEDTTTVCFDWTDAAPGPVPTTPGPWLELLQKTGAATGIDDRGIDVVTRVLEVDGQIARWNALLLLSNCEWDSLGDLMIAVGGKLHSPAFSRTSLRACDPAQSARCGRFDAPYAKNHPFPEKPAAAAVKGDRSCPRSAE